jgi:RsiW-degrading membrane proteinase PrsW (M82 family)
MALLVSLLFGFVPMFLFAMFVYWLDRYEKEPKALLGAAFLWGVVIAAGGAFIINTVFGIGIYYATGSEGVADSATTSVVAPFVEESLKGLAVLAVFLFFRREFDSVLDGIIYAGIVALGFAATENSFYIFSRGYQEGGWRWLWYLVFVRVVLVGWQHPFYTAFTGIGLAVARMNKSLLVRLIAVPLGFGVAVLAHAFHNSVGNVIEGVEGRVVGTAFDWFGWALMFVFIMFMIGRERALVQRHMQEEVSAGLITDAQLRRALSPMTMTTAGWSGPATARFYQAIGELAHKKEQYTRLGDEGGNLAIIDTLRHELSALSPQVRA